MSKLADKLYLTCNPQKTHLFGDHACAYFVQELPMSRGVSSYTYYD